MRKVLGLGMIMILILSVAASATTTRTSSDKTTPSSVYDRIWKKNIPVWVLSEERLEVLIKIAPNQQEKKKLESLRGKVGKRQTYYRRPAFTVAALKKEKEENREFSKDPKKLTKQDIADIFNIETIYDPIFKGNKHIRYMSKQRLISYLNNPVTQTISFNGREEWIRTKLKELGLEAKGYSNSAPRYRRGTIGPVSKPASTYGLKTRITKRMEKTKELNKRKGYYVISRATYK